MTAETSQVHPEEQNEIRDLYQQYLGKDVSDVTVDELAAVLQPASLLERFEAKRNAGISNNKEFLDIKGTEGLKGQMTNLGVAAEIKNENIGFKCMHYSVTESNGFVEITVVKRVTGDFTFGIRTVQDTAKNGSEFEALNKIIEMNGR